MGKPAGLRLSPSNSKHGPHPPPPRRPPQFSGVPTLAPPAPNARAGLPRGRNPAPQQARIVIHQGQRQITGHGHRREHRRPPGGRVRSFVEPRLLFLLARRPAYGYELMEELNEGEGAAIDPGLLYRTLHRFQDHGLVSSTWDTEAPGPARVRDHRRRVGVSARLGRRAAPHARAPRPVSARV
jgi:hypothetical protein